MATNLLETDASKTAKSMFVDTHVLNNSLRFLQTRLAEIKDNPEKEYERMTMLKLYETLREMYSKLCKNRSIRLDYW